MALHHILHATVSPILILLEVGDETRASDARQPSCSHPLYSPSQQQCWQIQAECCADQRDPALHYANASQSAPNGDS